MVGVGGTPVPPVLYLQALVGVSLLEKEFRSTGLVEGMRAVEGDGSTSAESTPLWEQPCRPACGRE